MNRRRFLTLFSIAAAPVSPAEELPTFALNDLAELRSYAVSQFEKWNKGLLEMKWHIYHQHAMPNETVEQTCRRIRISLPWSHTI